MPDDDEVIELRALQARAYGRGGGLTAADAARLDQLARRRAERAAQEVVADFAAPEPVISEVPDDGGHHIGAARRDSEPMDVVSPAAASPTDPPHDDDHSLRSPGTRALLRERWRPMLIGVAAVLAMGIGLGWFLFGRGGAEAVALTPRAAGMAARDHRRGDLRPGFAARGRRRGGHRAVDRDEERR